MPTRVARALLAFAIPVALPAGAGDVRTLAGDGTPGLRDGAPRSAQFLQPVALAYAPDGTLAVADAAAQRIRAIGRDGTVSTLAGGGVVDATGLFVAGGYRDGAARDARFDLPSGLAYGRDGALYIADKLNHCIRRYLSGSVSTFAGDPAKSGAGDGALQVATFRYPTALSFDSSGNLFVADFGTGVREITPGGRVTTLAMPGIGANVTGVSAAGSGSEETLFVANGTAALGLYRPSTQVVTVTNAVENDGSFGTALAVHALSPNDAIFTDPRTSTVRYFRAPHVPQLSHSNVRVIAGGPSVIPEANAGDVDGTALDARFDAPAGVDAGPDGRYAIADAGNRTVRSVAPADRRGPALDVGDFDAAPGTYRIAYFSSSVAFWGVPWPQSLAGHLEARLQREGPRFGLRAPVRVYAIRFDGASTQALRTYVDDVLSQGVVDFVVLDYGIAFVNTDLGLQPQLLAGGAWKANTAMQLHAMQTALAQGPCGFALLESPTWEDTAPSEMLYGRNLYAALDYDRDHALLEGLRAALAGSGVPVIDPRPAFWSYERRPDRGPLFETNSPHPTALNNAMSADAVADYLERLRPWAGAASFQGRMPSSSRAIASPM